jgi:hypothetical protein
MSVSYEDAKESLTVIKAVTAQTRKAVASAYAAPLLILWGSIWVVSFVLVHFYRYWAGYIFNAFNTIGAVATLWICLRWRAKAATKSPTSQTLAWRILGFWALLGVYIWLWLWLLTPSRGIQVCVFISTVAMFGYVVMGLWFGSCFMLYLGLGVTAITIFGYHFLPAYFFLWMAVMAGGSLFGTGLYIRIRWR